MRVIGLAIQKNPIINSSYKERVTQFNQDINKAIYVTINSRFTTPTLRNPNKKSISELAIE